MCGKIQFATTNILFFLKSISNKVLTGSATSQEFHKAMEDLETNTSVRLSESCFRAQLLSGRYLNDGTSWSPPKYNWCWTELSTENEVLTITLYFLPSDIWYFKESCKYSPCEKKSSGTDVAGLLSSPYPERFQKTGLLTGSLDSWQLHVLRDHFSLPYLL